MSYYVYVVGTETKDGLLSKPVKIGVTSNPSGRLATFRTSCPNKLHYAFWLDARFKVTARDLERDAHQFFSKFALEGEWFNISPAIAAEFLIRKFEELLIGVAARNSLGLGFIREELVVSGVDVVRRKLQEANYIDAWENQAA